MIAALPISNSAVKIEKVFLFLACIGSICYFLILYWEMIAEVKARVPETKVVLLSLLGLFPVLTAHKRAMPQSNRRLKALFCLFIIFVLFVLSVDLIFS